MPKAANTPTTLTQAVRRATPSRPAAAPSTGECAASAEAAIALAIGQKPESEKVRRQRARQQAVQTLVPFDPNAQPVMMELTGLTNDGRLVKFWDEDYPVRRVSKFLDNPRGPWIKDGKYLISYRGHLITCHCGNAADGRVTVQIMSNTGPTIYLPRDMVEPMLWGYVVPNEALEAEISKKLRECIRILRTRDDTPSRQRGHL